MSSKTPDIAVLSCPGYDRALVEQSVSSAFELCGGVEGIVRPGESVFLKINAVVPMGPDRCVTTHPEVVRAVVRELQGLTDRITIGDSPGGPFNRNILKRSYEKTGMADVAAETGAELNFDVAEKQVSVPDGKQMKRLVLCRPVVEADRVISISKLKTHVFMGLTCAVKNLYGAVPGMQKFTYHSRFHEAGDFAELIVDVAQGVRADFHLVDGVWGMEGNGSVWGLPRRMGIIAAGRDPFALDCYLGHLLGLKDGFNLPLAAAVERGLFHGDSSAITIAGDDPESLRVKGLELPTKKSLIKWMPGPVMRRYSSIMLIRPYPNPMRCTGCGKCELICPAHAITVADGVARVDGRMCIRCYCCHELCENDGLDLKRPLFAEPRAAFSRPRS
jgi:uncharacterized protein (DUF362 family)/Pyruvate/2-oxoacid:ferredoxin oxidoreductase delta subunit